jgi:hypothetical protein
MERNLYYIIMLEKNYKNLWKNIMNEFKMKKID